MCVVRMCMKLEKLVWSQFISLAAHSGFHIRSFTYHIVALMIVHVCVLRLERTAEMNSNIKCEP